MRKNDIKQEIKLYCIDCDGYTNQKFHTKLNNELLYVCEKCGCENIIEED